MGRSSAKYSEQDSYGKLKTLSVKRPVYEAAQELLKSETGRDGSPSQAATEKVKEAFAAGSLTDARFWSEVHLFIVSRDFLDGQLKIIEESGS